MQRPFRSAFLTLLVVFLAACVTTPRHYVPAGFKSIDEAMQYLPDYLYYALKLTREEWGEFYQRFPEYWQGHATG